MIKRNICSRNIAIVGRPSWPLNDAAAIDRRYSLIHDRPSPCRLTPSSLNGCLAQLMDRMQWLKLRHMNFSVRCTIAANHPSLPGHFPAAPVVPGVVILDEILAALTKWREDCQLTVIRAVKFLVPLKPEQPFTICLSAGKNAEGEFDFCCRVEDRVIVEGRLQVRCGSKPLP
jgi:3-hydroxyacyl-[acyl-carrier-protein] dehydratase